MLARRGVVATLIGAGALARGAGAGREAAAQEAPAAPGPGPAAGVPDLAGQLAREKSHAEGGAALLKRWVDKPGVLLQGQRLYADAKAASDEAIAHLAAALTAGEEPDRDAGLRRQLEAAVERRLAFSRHVDAALDALAGKKNVLGDALAKAAGEIVKGLLGAAVEVWKARAALDAARRETLRHQVEAERWRGFAEVAPA